MNWMSDIEFPLAEGAWRAWRPPFGRKREGESSVRRAIRQWHPLDPIVASTSRMERMLPPICIPELAPQLHRRMMTQYRWFLFAIFSMMIGFGGLAIHTDDVFFAHAGAAYFVFLAFVALQYIFLFQDLEKLKTHARFISWCHLQPRTPVVAAAFFMLAIGALQYNLQRQQGSLFNTIEKYGLVFDLASIEPWRYFFGPLLHAGPIHWISNFAFLIIGSGITFAVGRRLPLFAIFTIGSLVPSYLLHFMPHWVRLDAFVGISGGTFCLFGWLTGVAFRNRRGFPSGFWGIVGSFAIASGITASLLDYRASWFVHGVGYSIGLLSGTFCPFIRDGLLNPSGGEN